MRILLLIESPRRADISHAFYANALREMDHDVHVGEVNSVGWDGARFTCVHGRITGNAEPYGEIPHTATRGPVGPIDRVWLLNQPHPDVAVDVWQLLWRWNLEVPFVNSVTGLMMLNNKNNLPLVVPAEHLPEGIVSSDAAEILRQVDAGPEKWILKRPNGGCGSDVFVLSPGGANTRALAQSLTGNVHATARMTDPGLVGLQSRHAVLQRFVEHDREKRIVVCGGEVVAVQEKALPENDHRGNVAQDATTELSSASPEELELAKEIASGLAEHGVTFAGIDVAFPFVFEVNLVNPGGLVKRRELGLEDPGLHPALQALLDASASCAEASR